MITVYTGVREIIIFIKIPHKSYLISFHSAVNYLNNHYHYQTSVCVSLICWICYDIISIIQCFQCLAFHAVSIWYFFLDPFRIHIRYSVVLLLKPWKVSWSCKMKLMQLSKHQLSLIMIKIFVFSTFGLWFFVRYVPSFSCAVNGTHANALLECVNVYEYARYVCISHIMI